MKMWGKYFSLKNTIWFTKAIVGIEGNRFRTDNNSKANKHRNRLRIAELRKK